MFRKPLGCISIKHGQLAAYYEALLRVNDLSAFSSDDKKFKAAELKALVDAPGVIEVIPYAIEDDAALDADEIYGLPYVPPHLPDHTYIVHEPTIRRDPVTVFIDSLQKRMIVRFDGCSHQSGQQRAYVTCPTHPGCRRYVFVCNYDTWRRAVAWLLAWAAMKVDPDSLEEHVKSAPVEDAVDAFVHLVP